MAGLKASTTYYLIDVENCGNRWVDFYSRGSAYRYLLFYTQHSSSVPLQKILESCKESIGSTKSMDCTYQQFESIADACSCIEFFSCWPGKDAADMQLSSYLGYLLSHTKSGDKVIILSNDKGFDTVCMFWKARGFGVSRQSLDGTAPAQAETYAAKECRELIETYLKKKDKKYAKDIVILLGKEKDLQIIYQSLVKTHGQQKGSQLYKQVRPLAKKIYNSLNS